MLYIDYWIISVKNNLRRRPPPHPKLPKQLFFGGGRTFLALLLAFHFSLNSAYRITEGDIEEDTGGLLMSKVQKKLEN